MSYYVYKVYIETTWYTINASYLYNVDQTNLVSFTGHATLQRYTGLTRIIQNRYVYGTDIPGVPKKR